MSRFVKLLTFFLLITGFSLSACFGLPDLELENESPTLNASPSASGTDPAQEATAQPAAKKELNLCLGHEPNTLYPYAEPNPAAKSILAAIYELPIISTSYGYQAGVLQEIPSIQNGGVTFSTVPVTKGDLIVDADGELKELVQGVRLYPAGCHERDCIVTYKEDMQLSMEEMNVTFSLLDLQWADGEPITSDDSVYAFDLAIASQDPNQTYILARTAAYEAVDPLSVNWQGVPGFRDNTYMTNFWQPLPYHLWREFASDELDSVDIVSRHPLGWGPFIVDEWFPGESMRLIKNPLYYRNNEGLPYLDVLNVLFIEDPNTAFAALLDGECDLLDPSISLAGQAELLQQLDATGQLQFIYSEKISVESLYVGINPAAYDDAIVSGSDRAELLSDPRTRQALALCLDRQSVVDDVLHGLVSVPDAYIPNTHPLYTPLIDLYAFDPGAGAALLDEIGWRDVDNNEATPRIAYNVTGVPSGSELVLNYVTTTSLERRQASEILANSLRGCGIGVNLTYLSPEVFYAPAPDGVLLGRNFDLAQFAMGNDSLLPQCNWFMSDAVPNAENGWVGANLSGYRSDEFDTACIRAQHSLRGETDFVPNYQKTLAIYAADLPSIPLYPYLSVAAARPDMCGFDLDPSAQSPLWNVAEFDYGACAE
jgi:peptide/nickel transport system substrate-binding protein